MEGAIAQVIEQQGNNIRSKKININMLDQKKCELYNKNKRYDTVDMT